MIDHFFEAKNKAEIEYVFATDQVKQQFGNDRFALKLSEQLVFDAEDTPP